MWSFFLLSGERLATEEPLLRQKSEEISESFHLKFIKHLSTGLESGTHSLKEPYEASQLVSPLVMCFVPVKPEGSMGTELPVQLHGCKTGQNYSTTSETKTDGEKKSYNGKYYGFIII